MQDAPCGAHDVRSHGKATATGDTSIPSPFASRHDLIVHSHEPYNAEPRLDRLRAASITRQSDFYVRSHGNIPQLDGAGHRLKVGGLVRTPLELTVDNLRTRFTERSVMAVMQCAGNRRADMQGVKPTSGDPWAPGAIGNAVWTGVSLRDVLHAAAAEADPALHVAFDACDDVDMQGEGHFKYGVSIPMPKAVSPDVLLAYAMNGEALAPEHGYPLRVVVPGFAGVRSPKWLSRITVQDAPSDNHMQARDYKLLPADVTEGTVDWDQGVTIYDMPLNSAICEPAANSVLDAGRTTLRGYAVVTARTIVRVDVSIDGGRSWSQAKLEHDAAALWSWTFWSITLDLQEGSHELVVRAWDSAGQTQPAQPDDVWNFKGYLSAAWHRIQVSAR
ncbi:sulfite oxidase [Lichenicola cladoniae]|uniref:Sulfite oxidase n=2 Tax=Lichenicola cladoniae TaxID=1484109 RepID=A0A6M8HWR1_9PROT|nr:sulfite oxidase [Acetobacteraceae bacterium]QKE92842.1 sulfite oxidase [Lichenicola cladoniae]